MADNEIFIEIDTSDFVYNESTNEFVCQDDIDTDRYRPLVLPGREDLDKKVENAIVDRVVTRMILENRQILDIEDLLVEEAEKLGNSATRLANAVRSTEQLQMRLIRRVVTVRKLLGAV